LNMSLIPEEHREQIVKELQEKLEKPVKIVMFTQELECKFCAETKQVISELAALNGKITVEIYDFLAEAEKAKALGVDKIPAVVIMGEKDYGLKIYGMPYGYEFQTLMEAVILASRGRTDLSEATRAKVKAISMPVHIQVLVTLTCPYCPMAGSVAYKFAVENDLIKVDVVDVGEFPQLGMKYGVMGVPKTVINEKIEFVGAVPEDMLLEHVMLAIK